MLIIIKWFKDHADLLLKIFLFFITISLIVALFPKEYKFRYEFQEDKPWLYEDLIAPYDFAVKKTIAEIDKEKQEIIDNLHPYFVINPSIASRQREAIPQVFDEMWNKKYSGDQHTASRGSSLAFCLQTFDSIYRVGVIEMNPIIENKDADYDLSVLKNNISEDVELGSFFTIRTADERIKREADKAGGIDKDLCIMVLEKVLQQNILYDKEQTDREMLSRVNNLSLTRGIVQKGERVISRGEIINETKYQMIASLKEEYEGQSGGGSSYLMILGGQTILITIAIIMLVLFLIMFRKDIFADNKKISLILSMILLMVLTTSILIKRFNPDLVVLVPLCLVPFIIRAFFDTRLGLFVHIITIVITGFLVPRGYEFVFLQLIAGIVTIISVVNLEKRSQFFLTSVYVFLTYSVIYTGMNLAQDGNFDGIRAYNFMLFAGSSALTLLAFPLIWVYERVFGYVTNLSLLELSSLNNKVLRELSLKAPGTFQHSLQVANLAEEAVYRVGGNSILARTGALYHDLGKLEESHYFSENQAGGINPHENMDYIESAKIITGHVGMGIELARKFKVPEPIVDFIRTHHGTRKTVYFYSLYKKEHPDMTDDENLLFTYPGPLPFSKETAIVMMADAVEAASKSLKNPNKQNISELVESIIDMQIEQKQFKNSNITLKDITRVKNVFKQRLMNIYHIRIEYPK
jgi:putative nucleotidyltransferase with HDIG domain